MKNFNVDFCFIVQLANFMIFIKKNMSTKYIKNIGAMSAPLDLRLHASKKPWALHMFLRKARSPSHWTLAARRYARNNCQLGTNIYSSYLLSSKRNGWISAKSNLTSFKSDLRREQKQLLTRWWYLKTSAFRKTENILTKTSKFDVVPTEKDMNTRR